MIAVVEIFRKPGRLFLMPPSDVPLGPRSIIDLSHESLMRGWTRLVEWAEQDRRSSSVYMRLSQAARYHAEGTAGLCRDPELELGLQWKATPADAGLGPAATTSGTTAPWRSSIEASRNTFVRRRKTIPGAEAEASPGKVDRGRVRCALSRGRALWRTLHARKIAGPLENLRLAKDAVDQSLSSAGLDPRSAGADVPQLTEFRRELLEKAKVFYVDFLKQDARDESLRREMAMAHLRVGHID